MLTPYITSQVTDNCKTKSATPSIAARVITTEITTIVETVTSCLVDQLTFFISPSAAIIKSAMLGLFISHIIKIDRPMNNPTGIIVENHKLTSLASSVR